MEQQDQQLFTTKQVAKRFRCCEAHVLRLVRKGELQAVRLGGREWRFEEADLRSYLQRRKSPLKK